MRGLSRHEKAQLEEGLREDELREEVLRDAETFMEAWRNLEPEEQSRRLQGIISRAVHLGEAERLVLREALAREGVCGKRGFDRILKEAQQLRERELRKRKRPCALFPGLVDLVLDDKGGVAFLVVRDGDLQVTNSWPGEDGMTLRPPEREQIPL